MTEPNAEPGIAARLRHATTVPRHFFGTISFEAAKANCCIPAPTPWNNVRQILLTITFRAGDLP